MVIVWILGWILLGVLGTVLVVYLDAKESGVSFRSNLKDCMEHESLFKYAFLGPMIFLTIAIVYIRDVIIDWCDKEDE